MSKDTLHEQIPEAFRQEREHGLPPEPEPRSAPCLKIVTLTTSKHPSASNSTHPNATALSSVFSRSTNERP